MPERSIRLLCIALLLCAFGLDLVTPQLFVAAILLNVPIALGSLVFSRRFTQGLIFAALAANLVAGYYNGLADGGRWNPIAVADRCVLALSFLLVGGMSIATQTSATRAGLLAARQERAERERIVRRSIETIRGSMNSELIARSMVREACAGLGADRAVMYVFDTGFTSAETFDARGASAEVEVLRERPAAPILSLLQRVSAERAAIHITRADPIGRLVLDTLAVDDALIVTVEDRSNAFGALLVTRERGAFDAFFDEMLAHFVQQSAIALSQAGVFTQLAERNAQFASANAAIRERSDVIRDIVYALSHDLRTPLAAAGMTMRQALAGAHGELPPLYLDILRRSQEANDEVQRLAETLLLVSRYESGDQSTRHDRVALWKLTENVVRELEPLWQERGLSVSLKCSEPSIEVLGDAGELRRVVINLLANAVAFTPRDGSIDITLTASAARMMLSIADTGYGVPANERATLFARVQATSQRRGAGSGLGLYIVRRIAEHHGGSVRFAPREGGGSEFTIELPAASMQEEIA